MIEILHRFTCDAEGCDRTEEDGARPYYGPPREILTDPHKPDSWTQIGAWVYCAEHSVEIKIDHGTGKTINIKGAAV